MMRFLMIILCIGLGGGLGALSREGAMTLLHGELGMPRYIALACVNILGCLLIGIVFAFLEGMLRRDGSSRLRDLPHSKHLEKHPWWPEGDTTLSPVELLRVNQSLQVASALVITGFIGSFTTFSSFSLLSVHQLQQGDIMEACISVLGSIGLGLLAAWLGVHAGCRLGRKS